MASQLANDWYFTQGFKKKIRKQKVTTEVKNNSYISSKAIRLTRYDVANKLVSYWVDFDVKETTATETKINIRIINSLGNIIRFMDGTIDIKDKTLASSIEKKGKLTEKKKGELVLKLQKQEYPINIDYEIGLGLHHLEIITPDKLKNKQPSLQYHMDGKNYRNYWMTYEGKREGFHCLYKYSYEGKIQDSLMVSITPQLNNINNYYISFEEYREPQIFIYNDEQKHAVEVVPYGGYGQDCTFAYMHPFLHTFEKEGLLKNYIGQIGYGRPLQQLDFLRDSSTLKVVYETIKYIGYDQFLSKNTFIEKKYTLNHKDKHLSWKRNSTIAYSLQDINDSLIFYYDKKDAPMYYQEFWKRREKEKNKALVFKILSEVQHTYKDNYLEDDIEVNRNFVNDTLQFVLRYDLFLQQVKEEEKADVLTEYYNYLNDLGFAHSAYNLVFLSQKTEHIMIDREKIWEDLKVNRPVYKLHNKKYFLNQNQAQWIDVERFSRFY